MSKHGYADIEKYRATRKRYNQGEKGKASQKIRSKRYNLTEKGRATRKRYENSEKGKTTKKQYSSSERGKVSRQKAQARFKSTEHGKLVRRAHHVVKYAIKNGQMVRGPCVVCGDPNTEKHHPDYTKPLETVDLCHCHHLEEHLKVKLA